MSLKRIKSSKFIDRTGEIHFNKQGYSMKIIEFFSTRNCTIQFENGVVFKNMQYGNVKLGNIKNPYHPTNYNIGYIGVGNFTTCINNIDTVHYVKWNGLLNRCYNEKNLKRNPTYKDCIVDEHWHNFQNFAKWHEENYDPKTMQGWALDKDILIKNNKIYSPETCCFVPTEINCLFTKTNAKRGQYPIGVFKNWNRFGAQMLKYGNKVYLGTFDTPEEAFQVYKEAKEKYIKEVADKWKDLIDPRVYEAMYNYKVEVND